MNRPRSWPRSLWTPSSPQYSALPQSTPFVTKTPRSRCWSLRGLLRRLPLLLRIALVVLVVDVLGTAIFFPSYTHLPPCYKVLKEAASSSNIPGRANPRNEKVFIAAILYDRTGDLAGGQWGTALTALIDLLGEENVFLSLYENNSGPRGEAALHSLAARIPCNKSIVIDPHTSFDHFPRITLPTGESRIKRIDYLAALRNRALDPLVHPPTTFDKLLYLNDVVFDPLDAAQLLFCTNANPTTASNSNKETKKPYRAACAVDFANPFKFYDTYATRDLQGYGPGLPFFPWFTTAGRGESRRDVLEGRDAVRVRSCWGGMVAFDAEYFQRDTPAPVRFRADAESFWDASECCLIHADIQDVGAGADGGETGVYMNPFVRVAYGSRSLQWLKITRRFEGLYPLVHDVLNRLVGLPWYNPRRGEVAGEKVQREVWVTDGSTEGGEFRTVDVVAGKGGFCGRRGMEVVMEHRKPGQDGFEAVPVPTLRARQ